MADNREVIRSLSPKTLADIQELLGMRDRLVQLTRRIDSVERSRSVRGTSDGITFRWGGTEGVIAPAVYNEVTGCITPAHGTARELRLDTSSGQDVWCPLTPSRQGYPVDNFCEFEIEDETLAEDLRARLENWLGRRSA